jgi:hypothetical protein
VQQARAETAPGFLRDTLAAAHRPHPQQVRERFRRMVAEGSANQNDAYIIFRWQW